MHTRARVWACLSAVRVRVRFYVCVCVCVFQVTAHIGEPVVVRAGESEEV